MSNPNTMKLRSGREIRAYAGVLGLGPDLELVSGFDDKVLDCEAEPFTDSERQEIASMMIDRWNQWAMADEVNDEHE